MAFLSPTDSGLTCDKLIHEQAVALVGGDASGGGVGLRNVPLVLQDRHVVADRGRETHAGDDDRPGHLEPTGSWVAT